MKASRKEYLLRTRANRAIVFLILCCLIPPGAAAATAPRVAPPLFGDESQADVVGYQAVQTGGRDKAEGQLILALLKAAFEVGGMQPIIDILPSKQLARYEFVVNEAPALIIRRRDLTDQRIAHAHQIVFYLRNAEDEAEATLMVFGENSPRARELHRAFDKGMQTIVENGRYLDLMRQHLGAGAIAAGMIDRLKRLNPGWK